MSEAVLLDYYRRVLPEAREPYAYQLDVGRRLLAGENVVLGAPTGAGKTYASLVPFLVGRPEGRWSRLIYALPLRTLARGIFKDAEEAVEKLGLKMKVAMQTGEQPDCEFFTDADIIVCTYDQILSGLLAAPYSLPRKLANINGACIAAALVVFDEFHLMAADRAFLTAAASFAQFGSLTQSLWMSATATEPLVGELKCALRAKHVQLPKEDWESVASIARVRRTVHWRSTPLSPEEIEAHRGQRTVVICNRVEWARDLYEAIRKDPDWPVKLLHSRFFRKDREEKERWMEQRFGKRATKTGLLICTQVIEAGIDITSDVLLTQIAPMNSLVQRAGRCARFPPRLADGSITSGQVHVFEVPEEAQAALPYTRTDLDRSREILSAESAEPVEMSPGTTRDWVERAHKGSDTLALVEGWQKRGDEVRRRIALSLFIRKPSGVTDLIRDVDDNVRVYLDEVPPDRLSTREPLSVSRWSLAELARERTDAGWAYLAKKDEMVWEPLTPENLKLTYFATLRPTSARYTSDAGLVLGQAGEEVSPGRKPPRRPGHGTLRLETWIDHTRAVIAEVENRVRREIPEGSAARAALPEVCCGINFDMFLEAARFCALMHDFGKLQDAWQQWAIAYELDRVPSALPPAPLAHTKFDRRDPADCDRQERIDDERGERPAHAAQSACYSAWVAGSVLRGVPEGLRAALASASCAAITSHHGGWLPQSGTSIRPLWKRWREILPFLISHRVCQDALEQPVGKNGPELLASLSELMDETTDADALIESWPLLALLMRVLRLSDQRATAEGSQETHYG